MFCSYVRMYGRTDTINRNNEPLFKLVLWLVLGRGSTRHVYRQCTCNVIPSTRPIVTPVANIVFQLFCFSRIEKLERTTCAKTKDPTDRDFGLTEWINKTCIVNDPLNQTHTRKTKQTCHEKNFGTGGSVGLV